MRGTSDEKRIQEKILARCSIIWILFKCAWRTLKKGNSTTIGALIKWKALKLKQTKYQTNNKYMSTCSYASRAWPKSKQPLATSLNIAAFIDLHRLQILTLIMHVNSQGRMFHRKMILSPTDPVQTYVIIYSKLIYVHLGWGHCNTDPKVSYFIIV